MKAICPTLNRRTEVSASGDNYRKVTLGNCLYPAELSRSVAVLAWYVENENGKSVPVRMDAKQQYSRPLDRRLIG